MYFIFTTTLLEIPIIIGFDNTIVVLTYLAQNNVMFESLCFQTVYIIHVLSAKLGFLIYIPAITNIYIICMASFVLLVVITTSFT